MAVVSKRSRSDDPVSIDGLDEAVLRGMYRAMLLTRSVEERGHSLYRQGRIPGSFYTGRGNEAAAVGVAWAMAAQDVGCPTQRDLGVHIVRGMAPWRILAQYLGRSDGPTQGRDGNVHLGDAGLGTLTMVSHLPAMLPVAVGCALAFRVRNEPRVALGWFGDGGSARGDAHEAMNFAGVRRLPMVFVLDNNGFAYSTPAHLEYGVTHLAERAAAYGFGGRGRRRHRRRRRLSRRAGGDRARPQRRRTDAARARDAAHGGARGARRRVLRAARAARRVARAGSRSRCCARACWRPAARSTRPPTRRSAARSLARWTWPWSSRSRARGPIRRR